MTAPRTVLVTGVAGFIGSRLAARLLAQGTQVVGIDDLSQGVIEQVPAGVTFCHADVRDPAIESYFDGVDAVFHLAAKNCISDCQADPVATASINVLGTVQVFEAARRAGVRRIIHAESAALYEGVARVPTPEDEIAPRSVYAAGKLAARVFAETYERYHQMQVTALRYFCVYGAGQDHRRSIPPVMSAFITRLLTSQRPVIYGTGDKRRDFVHVDDINDFHLQCLTDERTVGRTFNLGSGESHSVREILDRVCRLLGVEADPAFLPDQPGEALESCADITAAASLGWRPRVALDDGLREMIAHLRGVTGNRLA